MKVKDPTGQTWRVSRRWVPWRRRLKDVLDVVPDTPVLGDDPISLVIGGIILILMLPFLLLLVVAGLEFLLLLLVLPFAILGRVLFGRHWTIEARRGWRATWEEPAGDWAQSRQAIRDVATALERGHWPPSNL